MSSNCPSKYALPLATPMRQVANPTLMAMAGTYASATIRRALPAPDNRTVKSVAKITSGKTNMPQVKS